MNSRKKITGFILILVAIVIFPAHIFAQDKNAGTSKYSIRITKKTDGKVITADTTFETKGNFDVDAWIKKRDLASGNEKQQMKDIRISMKSLRDTMQRSGSESGTFPSGRNSFGDKFLSDTIVMNHDTIIMKGNHQLFMKRFPGAFSRNGFPAFPDSIRKFRNELRAFSFDGNTPGITFKQDTIVMNADTIIMQGNHQLFMQRFPEAFSWNSKTPFPGFREFEFRKGPLNDSLFNLRVNPPKSSHNYIYRKYLPDGIDEYLPDKQPEKVTIVKKRHGKKIIITTKDPEQKEGKISSEKKGDEVLVIPDRQNNNPKVIQRVYVHKSSDGKTEVQTETDDKAAPKGARKIISRSLTTYI